MEVEEEQETTPMEVEELDKVSTPMETDEIQDPPKLMSLNDTM